MPNFGNSHLMGKWRDTSSVTWWIIKWLHLLSGSGTYACRINSSTGAESVGSGSQGGALGCESSVILWVALTAFIKFMNSGMKVPVPPSLNKILKECGAYRALLPPSGMTCIHDHDQYVAQKNYPLGEVSMTLIFILVWYEIEHNHLMNWSITQKYCNNLGNMNEWPQYWTQILMWILSISTNYMCTEPQILTGHILTYRMYFARKIVAEKNGLIKPFVVYKQLHTTTINISKLQASSRIQ